MFPTFFAPFFRGEEVVGNETGKKKRKRKEKVNGSVHI